MRALTHELGGITAGLVYASLASLEPKDAVIVAGVSAIGALIPDIDHRGSKISHKMKVASAAISAVTTHRGICHAPILYIALSLILSNFFPVYAPIFLGLLLGALSHIFLDMLNPTGVPILYPFSGKKIHIAKIKTGSLTEQIVKGLLFVADIALAYIFFS